MSIAAQSILDDLIRVDAERARRARDAALAARVLQIKGWQQRRFAHTYADLMASARYGAAARFFLEELYGPQDFSERDSQFARVVPAMARVFPADIVDTVAQLAALHALSESLDSEMAVHWGAPVLGLAQYAQAWRDVGRVEDRERQIALTLAVGAELDRLTRKPLIRHTLRLMRGPAQAAGLGALQRFLESGFDTFRAMRGSQEFLRIVGERERQLAAGLFAADDAQSREALDRLLGQVP